LLRQLKFGYRCLKALGPNDGLVPLAMNCFPDARLCWRLASATSWSTQIATSGPRALLRVVTKGLTSPGSHDQRLGKP